MIHSSCRTLPVQQQVCVPITGFPTNRRAESLVGRAYCQGCSKALSEALALPAPCKECSSLVRPSQLKRCFSVACSPHHPNHRSCGKFPEEKLVMVVTENSWYGPSTLELSATPDLVYLTKGHEAAGGRSVGVTAGVGGHSDGALSC